MLFTVYNCGVKIDQEFAMYILTGIVVEAAQMQMTRIRIAISGCIQITLRRMPSRNHTSLF